MRVSIKKDNRKQDASSSINGNIITRGLLKMNGFQEEEAVNKSQKGLVFRRYYKTFIVKIIFSETWGGIYCHITHIENEYILIKSGNVLLYEDLERMIETLPIRFCR